MKPHRILSAVLLAVAAWAGPLWSDAPAESDDARFDKLHALVRRQPGESRWMEIDWFPNVWEARQRAAAEGKPIFLMAGSGGAPAAGC